MKLYLEGHGYKYAVEQMLLMLFPGEKPQYPDAPPLPVENALFSTLAPTETGFLAGARLRLDGVEYEAARPVTPPPGGGNTQTDRALSHGIKLAFFQAAVQATGEMPLWGALTGVRPAKLAARALTEGRTETDTLRLLEEEYCVSQERAGLTLDCARAGLAVQKALPPDSVSVYLGIPFCPSRCAYCSFVSTGMGSAKTMALVEPYLAALMEEIAATGAALKRAGRGVHTLYLGGGTPTTLSPEQLHRLFTALKAHIPLDGCIEITVEAGRPDTITREKLAVLQQCGVGRVSVNPQTLRPSVLEAMGRSHTVEQFRSAFQLARQMGFPCLNADLIAGLPGDDLSGFCASLDGVLALGPENVTVHTLARKRGSTLGETAAPSPGAAETARMLDYAMQRLRGAGYGPYYLYRQKYMSGALENVGWCKPGTQSVYNICMMEELHTVFALGAGGVTKVVDAPNGRIRRFSNPKYPQDYLSALPGVLEQKERAVSMLTAPPVRKEP